MTTKERDIPSVDEAKAEQALQLFMAGYHYDRITQVLGYKDEATAKAVVENALDEQDLDSIKHLRLLEFARLDEIHKVYCNNALTGIGPDHLKATKMIIRIMKRRSKLMGLDKKSKNQMKMDWNNRINIIWDPFKKHKK